MQMRLDRAGWLYPLSEMRQRGSAALQMGWEMEMKSVAEYEIVPIPKPRQTQADKWKLRPPVVRYRRFADELRFMNFSVESGDHISFYMLMPSNWSKKKKLSMENTPHRNKPDIDNLLKSVLDSVLTEDKHIWKISCAKYWSQIGKIIVERDT